MIEGSQATPWYRQAAAVMPLHPYLKGIGTTVFISLFFVAYFYVLKNPARPPTVMPVTWLDRVIGFEPLALPAYLSLWLYVSLVPALFSTRAELCRYGLSMTAMCVAGLSIFYFWPTGAPVPDIDWSRHPDIDFLKNIDASGNACPSLHVATAFFSAVWFHRLLSRFGGPGWILALNWAWCVAIVYSTIAIRQHVAVDAGAGLLLGGLAAWLSLRDRWRPTAAANAGGPSP
jgi:membrane-associated phospholipid phosphatase